MRLQHTRSLCMAVFPEGSPMTRHVQMRKRMLVLPVSSTLPFTITTKLLEDLLLFEQNDPA
jgi:hypothetical protein